MSVIPRGVLEPGKRQIRMSSWPEGLTEGLFVATLAAIPMALACPELARSLKLSEVS